MGSHDKPKVLGDNSFSESGEAPYWENGTKLLLDGNVWKNEFQSNRLDEFPLIEDFSIHLEDVGRDGSPSFGYHLYFFSHSLGYVASFPWWDHAELDLIRGNFKIPLGSFQHLHFDAEQSWIILIATKDNLVYVVQGDFDTFEIEGYYTWFKVDKDRYLDEWQRAIDLCKRYFNDRHV